MLVYPFFLFFFFVCFLLFPIACPDVRNFGIGSAENAACLLRPESHNVPQGPHSPWASPLWIPRAMRVLTGWGVTSGASRDEKREPCPRECTAILTTSPRHERSSRSSRHASCCSTTSPGGGKLRWWWRGLSSITVEDDMGAFQALGAFYSLPKKDVGDCLIGSWPRTSLRRVRDSGRARKPEAEMPSRIETCIDSMVFICSWTLPNRTQLSGRIAMIGRISPGPAVGWTSLGRVDMWS